MARLSGTKKAWRDVPDDPDKARLEIKHLKPGETKDIEDQIELYETVLRRTEGGEMSPEVKVNPAKGDKRYAYLCASVTDWENYFDEDGKPMACTDENKIRVARDDPEFGPLVGRFRTELADIVAKEREGERKNSKK